MTFSAFTLRTDLTMANHHFNAFGTQEADAFFQLSQKAFEKCLQEALKYPTAKQDEDLSEGDWSALALVDTRVQTGPKSLAPVGKASDAGAIARTSTREVLKQQEKAKEDDRPESFYITDRCPVWSAAKAIIVVGLGKQEA